MAISTNQKPTIYRNLYENTGPGAGGGPGAVAEAAWKGGDSGFTHPHFKFQRNKMFLLRSLWRFNIAWYLRDREVACAVSDRQDSNFKSCVWRAVSSHLSRHPQQVLLAQFSLHVHKGGLKPHAFQVEDHSRKSLKYLLFSSIYFEKIIFSKYMEL